MSETPPDLVPDIADRVVAATGEAFTDRAGAGFPLLVGALVSALQDIANLTDPATNDWAGAFDLDTTPAPGWLGAITGTPVPNGLDLESTRAYVRNRPAWRRGTPGAILAAARAAYSRGHIELLERNGSPWRATLLVYGATELELEQIRVAAVEQKPVGIVLTVEAATGASYEHLRTFHGTYAQLAAEFPTYDAMTAHQPEEGSVP